MRRFMVMGGWYALLFAASLLADSSGTKVVRKVSSSTAPIRSEASNLDGDDIATVNKGEDLEVTGEMKEGFIPIRMANGKTGWIADSDLFTTKEMEKLATTSGAGAANAKKENEGAYVKGFDPEVEGKMREDHPDLDKIFREEVFPWVWTVRAGDKAGYDVSQQLETVEEDQERFLIQGKPDEAAKLQKQIDDLRVKVKPYRDKWQADLKAYRQAGKLGTPEAKK